MKKLKKIMTEEFTIGKAKPTKYYAMPDASICAIDSHAETTKKGKTKITYSIAYVIDWQYDFKNKIVYLP